MAEARNILWRRLDTPGHDACRLVEGADAWRIEGSAVFQHPAGAAALDYAIECDREWRTRSGAVIGWVGSQPVDLRITRSRAGAWAINGEVAPNLRECADLDLGFTPATNLSQLRRMDLQVGQSADISVAWLDVPPGSLEVLRQQYERRAATAYWYEAPRFGYKGLLQIRSDGFVEKYPALWEAESC